MEIKMVHCPNGHYYNAAIHASCPMCGGGSGNFSGTVDPSAAGQGSGNFGGTVDPSAAGRGSGNFGGTIDPHSAGRGGGNFERTKDPHAAGRSGVDPTISPWDDSETGQFSKTLTGEDLAGGGSSARSPVVGWLVCIEGAAFGASFELRGGYNYIGRESGDVRLPDDPYVSRKDHAMVAYDSGSASFYFGPSGGRNLVKVNGKPVFNAVEIHSHDIISIGQGRYIFVPLCGPNFDWRGGMRNA